MASATKSTMKDPLHAKTGKGQKVAAATTIHQTGKDVPIIEGIENIGAKERIDIPDDGRTLLVSRYPFGTSAICCHKQHSGLDDSHAT